MDGLPKLPGYTFRDVAQTRFNIPQQFTMRNGFAIPRNVRMAVGGKPLDADGIGHIEEDDLCG